MRFTLKFYYNGLAKPAVIEFFTHQRGQDEWVINNAPDDVHFFFNSPLNGEKNSQRLFSIIFRDCAFMESITYRTLSKILMYEMKNVRNSEYFQKM